jgi:dipeptidyl-peptidase-3
VECRMKSGRVFWRMRRRCVRFPLPFRPRSYQDPFSQVLSNLSNFKSFGATKFIPRVPEAAFAAVVSASERSSVALPFWEELKSEIYSLSPEASLSIGKPSQGHRSSYYPSSPAPSDEQVNEVQALADAAGVSTLNTRLSLVSPTELVLRFASVSSLPSTFPKSLKSEKLGFEVRLEGGDYKDALEKVNAALKEAEKYARDGNQSGMLKDYVQSFEHGDIEAHKDGSRKWVKDVSPVVEVRSLSSPSSLTYADPLPRRATSASSRTT